MRLWPFLTIVIVIGGVAIAWPSLDHFLLTGRFFPIDRIDTLNNAQIVIGWSADGLLLSDGSDVQLPGCTKLPEESEALREAIREGIERTGDGRIIGLMRIHHWCGSDPVRNHVARVDLAHLLIFLGEGEFTRPTQNGGLEGSRDECGFSRAGWNVSDFFEYEQWLWMLDGRS